MSYTYTVKPLNEAIKIAIECNDFNINEAGLISIYGIEAAYWPAGTENRTVERKNKGYIRMGENGYALPMRYFTEHEEINPEVPEFIQNLYKATKASCQGVKCSKCPLYHINFCRDGEFYQCANFFEWIKKEWPEL